MDEIKQKIAELKLGSAIRPTILDIGDGGFQYSVQSIYTTVQHKAKLLYLVPINKECAVLNELAVLEQNQNVPGLDLPGLNAMAVAKAYSYPTFRAENVADSKKCFEEALKIDGPALVEFPIDWGLWPLVAPVG